MRHYLIILCSFISLTAFGQRDSGFTDKKEAKNLMVNGLKEGKWVEYYDADVGITIDTNAPYYSLVTYKAGKELGISRTFYKSGKLRDEIPNSNGYINGNAKSYYESGELESEGLFKDDIPIGIAKKYYKNGKLKSETTWNNGQAGATKSYDKSGNEIKQ